MSEQPEIVCYIEGIDAEDLKAGKLWCTVWANKRLNEIRPINLKPLILKEDHDAELASLRERVRFLEAMERNMQECNDGFSERNRQLHEENAQLRKQLAGE